MLWLGRILALVGWGLVITSGWLKGGDDGSTGTLLAMFLVGFVAALLGFAVSKVAKERDVSASHE